MKNLILVILSLAFSGLTGAAPYEYLYGEYEGVMTDTGRKCGLVLSEKEKTYRFGSLKLPLDNFDESSNEEKVVLHKLRSNASETCTEYGMCSTEDMLFYLDVVLKDGKVDSLSARIPAENSVTETCEIVKK